ncbi:hypothetical protein R1CP_20630 [Rhodococcus opacus]|uniref:Uncharacterized protein n=1 Tax=Rhodococcus opacus TaxID=37919 RepID=A0A1B1K8B3_RHOOP|nr:hypothetical protein R1CP_20630 [Rhodococcus opacus]
MVFRGRAMRPSHSIDEVDAGGRIIDRVPRIRKGRQPVHADVAVALLSGSPTDPQDVGRLDRAARIRGDPLFWRCAREYDGNHRVIHRYRTRAVAGHVGVPRGPRAGVGGCDVVTVAVRVVAGFGSRSCAHSLHSPDLGRVAWGCSRSRPAAFWVGGVAPPLSLQPPAANPPRRVVALHLRDLTLADAPMQWSVTLARQLTVRQSVSNC